SQNNNIKRIKGIVKSLCENFGERLSSGAYTFPSYEVIAKLTPDDLAPIRSGFRAKYLIDGAKKVASGEVSFEYLKTAPIDSAREHLKQIKGVGDKVAECVLLYGLNRLDAFPIDVWIKRALDEGYSGRMPQIPSEYMGVAQQYIFHYIRTFGKLKDL
ncbi:MAG: DNA-3-methyladenine glycosylase 2 family protein, partial [Oscillospiraceae bacterium]|nr:DNA-3-methyladenine glycosylase 2 family protein [Oscillospiraceae bacterium]